MGSITGQAGTNLGPLTTVWTPSPSCTALMPLCDACDSGYLAQRCDLSIEGAGSLRDNTDCWPPVQSKVASPTHPFVGWGFYSPGIQCPTGYTSACTAEYNKRPEWPLQFTLIESETAVGCCPIGFDCANAGGQTCIRVALSTENPITIKTASCLGDVATDIREAVFPDMVTQTDATATITEVRQMTMFAPMIQINFQSSDLADDTSSTTGASKSTVESPTIASGALPAETSSSSGNTGAGLTGGAMIGVIVGVVAGGLGLLTLVVSWMFWRRRRASEAPAAAGMPPHAPYQEVQHGFPPSWGHAGVYELEAPQSSPAELGNRHDRAAELDAGKGTPAEMPAYHSGEVKPGDDHHRKDGYRS